jgi:hypothetical protein
MPSEMTYSNSFDSLSFTSPYFLYKLDKDRSTWNDWILFWCATKLRRETPIPPSVLNTSKRAQNNQVNFNLLPAQLLPASHIDWKHIFLLIEGYIHIYGYIITVYIYIYVCVYTHIYIHSCSFNNKLISLWARILVIFYDKYVVWGPGDYWST